MKHKLMYGIALGFAIVGLVFLVCCIFGKNESSHFLTLGLLCTTIGNFVTVMLSKKQK